MTIKAAANTFTMIPLIPVAVEEAAKGKLFSTISAAFVEIYSKVVE